MRIKESYLYLPITIALLAATSLLAQEDAFREVKELRDDIQIINLLNNLSLRPNQMELILQKAKEAKAIYDLTEEKIDSYKSEMTGSIAAIKEEVEEGKVIVEKESAAEFHRLKEEIEELIRRSHKKIEGIAAEVESNLEEFQLLALDGYQPCIIPIVTDGRVGQADSSKGVGRILEKVRYAPSVRYEQMKEELAQRIIEKVKHKLPPRIELDENQARVKILEVFEKVRSMEDAEFSVQKDKIAEELESKILPEKPQIERSEKIMKFLLADNVIPILEDRLSKAVNQR